MSKRLNNMKWESVALEGFPVSMSDKFQGFVGLEECTEYALDKENKKSKKNKLKEWKEKVKARKEQKKKRKSESEIKEVPNKKVKLSNGFIVESCPAITPSLTNTVEKNKIKNKSEKEIQKDSKIKSDPLATNNQIDKEKNKNDSKIKNKQKSNKNKEGQIKKPKLGDLPNSESDLTPEDMLTWAEFKLQEPIIKALMELGFKQPTKIQQMTLPAAIHGRRDILGAAETGSGKTLAFGLPILSGILKLKEKAELKGIDVYDIPYKKNSTKKKIINDSNNKNKKENKSKIENKKKKEVSKEPEYSNDDENGDEEADLEVNNDNDSDSDNDQNSDVDDDNDVDDDDDIDNDDDKTKISNGKDYLEEFVVPIKNKTATADENDESDDENYIHLSDMLDSDDLAESSSDNDDDDVVVNGDESDGSDGKENDESDSEEETDSQNEVDNENEGGIGCVKVIDNIEIPGHVSMKTGKPLYALILTPTRELAIQISRHLIAAAKYTGIRVATIVGGMAAVKQERVLRSGPEVVVATPGRLWELIGQGQPHLQQLDTVKFLAIDETDRMIERGHFDELYPLLERLNADETQSSARQNFVFSATLTMVHELPSHMKGKKVTKRGKIINRKIEKMSPQQKVNRLVKLIGMTEPKVVDITTENSGTAETLTESRIACSLEHKDAHLYYILKRHPGRTIVFCNSIGSVRRLAQLLTLLKCRPLPLHANMPQRQRLKNLERFRDDVHGVLIATDVAARGLDIPHVEHVIHYQVPRTAENYVHRSGRTARATREGLTILMMEPAEAYLYTKLCRTLNKTSEVPSFPIDPQILSPLKDLVNIARELDSLELKKRRTAQAAGWRERTARDMDIIIDEDDIPVTQVDSSIEKALKNKKRQLDSLLSRPLYPKGFSFKYPTLNDPNALRNTEENALQVMKNAIASGQLKKDKRKSKNAPLLQLQKKFKKK